MATYKISSDAETDLYRIWLRGVREYGEDKADKYHDNFITRFEELAENPCLYSAVTDIREGYRRSVCGVDNIYYRIDGDTVEIMNVLGKQNIDDWL